MDIFPVIPGYRIEKELGTGRLSTVYLGVQEDLDQQVVIKVLLPEVMEHRKIKERFLKEAQKAANFTHVNVAAVLEAGESEENYYIVTEYLPRSLKNRINAKTGKAPMVLSSADELVQMSSGGSVDKELSGPAVIEIMKQVTRALDYAHKQGCHHQDITPNAIRIREDGTVLVSGFFISRVLGDAQLMKQKGISYTTPHYISPEQALRKKVDGRSDIYSLGVVFFEALTGSVPYQADEAIAIENMHIMEPVPWLPDSLTQYQELLDRMMAKNVNERAADPQQLLRYFEDLPYKMPEERSPGQAPAPETASPPPIQLDIPGVPDSDPVKTAEIHETQDELSFDDHEDFTIDDELESAISKLEQEADGPPPAQSVGRRPSKPANNLLAILLNPKILVPVVAAAVIAGVLLILLDPFSGPGEPTAVDLTSPEKKQARTKSQPLPKPAKADSEQDEKPGSDAAPDTAASDPTANMTEDEKKKYQENLPFYQHNIRLAQRFLNNNQFQKARDKLADAEKYLKTEESKKVAADIEKKAVEQKDHDAYHQALADNSTVAIVDYLNRFPSGLHTKEAEEKLRVLKAQEDKEAARQRKLLSKRIALPSYYADLSKENVKAMLKEFGLFDKYYHKEGDFKNHFILKTIGMHRVVLDYATGLMWHPSGSPRYMKNNGVSGYLDRVNAEKYAGFSDWRLPTLAEAASLLEKTENRLGLYVDSMFDSLQQYIWTGDTFERTRIWAVDFYGGDLNYVPPNTSVYVRPVRSLIKDKKP